MNPMIITGVDDREYYVNPAYIVMYTEATEAAFQALGYTSASICEGSTLLIISGGVVLQIKETPSAIHRSMLRAKKQAEQELIDLRKRMEQDDWQEGYDDE